jgi:hypothetical protein
MLVFILLTVLSVAGLLIRQSTLRFRAASAADSVPGKGPRFAWPAYVSWLGKRARELGTKKALSRAWAVLKAWAADHYPGPLGWVFAGLVISFLYQAASGFFFALFVPRGMFGLPLLAHVGSGGLFALSLAAVMFWRARDYGPGKTAKASFSGFACPVFKNLSRSEFSKMAFWALAFFGFIQVATALGSMLPVFTFRTQVAIIRLHRYSALALLLSVILFADLVFLPPPKKPGDSSSNSGT